ncbi:MAG TPA: squalene--hopene cyclase [Steroidobacteraceae bacterium]|nr:squalene--hopene cyclase [Steroidobacteraceae bacterium]
MNRTSPVPDSDPAETRAPAQARAPQPAGGFVQRSYLDRAIDAAREALSGVQNERGYWLFELEADCTISAEYILMQHFLGEIDRPLETKIAAYLRARQAQHGGWPLYQGGELDISCTVKAYFALKLAGDSAQAPHMLRARAALLERGGAARANVFTRITLALFGQVPWRAVPYIPVEIMLLPRWFPFHLDKVSYWSRTVMVPLLILCTRRPRAKNPRNVDITELFTTPPEEERHYFRTPGGRSVLLARAFLVLDRCARRIDPLIPGAMRRRATRRAEAWILERLNGEDGLGAIFPAMVNAVEALTVLSYASEDPRLVAAKRALHKLLVIGAESAYCQPCVSPIWDTALATLALQDEGSPAATAASDRALRWLQAQQLLEQPGDWQVNRPALPGGGWAFQFSNSFYPDLDDTAAIVWAMRRASDAERYSQPVDRALDWLVGMQSRNGGFASFDVDNVHYRLNHIPFADHGALLDPPTSDVTARVVTALATVGRPQDKQPLERAVAFLRREQEADGSWFGRWGTNYIYGTWSVLTALAQARVRASDEAVGRAVRWLCERQNSDGGWGESNDSYAQAPAERRPAASTSFQSAWALLGLIAAGQVHSDVVRHGIDYLLRTRNAHGLWNDPGFTAPGFPRVFYLKYHGYSAYFPLWALAAYRSLARSGGTH